MVKSKLPPPLSAPPPSPWDAPDPVPQPSSSPGTGWGGQTLCPPLIQWGSRGCPQLHWVLCFGGGRGIAGACVCLKRRGGPRPGPPPVHPPCPHSPILGGGHQPPHQPKIYIQHGWGGQTGGTGGKGSAGGCCVRPKVGVKGEEQLHRRWRENGGGQEKRRNFVVL